MGRSSRGIAHDAAPAPDFVVTSVTESWSLGAAADVGNTTQEFFEDNNRLAGTRITFNP